MKKFYWTKKRKNQLMHWAIIHGTFLLAVAIIGHSQVTTDRAASWVVDSIGIPPVEATTIEAKQETVEETIRRLAQETGFKWSDYLVRLAYCESRFDPNATNDNGRYGIDRGVFQINSYYHGEVTDAQAFDLEWATRWTMDRINRGYQHEWMCDPIIRKK